MSADLVIPVFLGFKYPGYNHFHDTISTLGTDTGIVRILSKINLILVGVLFLIYACGQISAFTAMTWSHRWYIAGIFIFAIGCILAGIFSEDPKGKPESASGKIHGITSGIGFIMLLLNPLWAVFMAECSHVKIINMILFFLGVITFILFIISEKSKIKCLRFTGLFQRLNLLILYGCLIFNAVLFK